MYIRKFDRFGNETWNRPFLDQGVTTTPIYDILVNNFGNLYVLGGDSLLELDMQTGNSIRSDSNIIGRNLFEMTNGDLILKTFTDSIKRIDITGNTLWSTRCNGALPYQMLKTLNHVFAYANDTVIKIDLNSGIISDTLVIPGYTTIENHRSIEMTKDGGFITEGMNLKFDSMGVQQWSKNYPFAAYGLHGIFECADGGYISGGTYRVNTVLYLAGGFVTDWCYSAFLVRVDSLGNGPIDSTSKIWPGDANDNKILGFLDDALFIAQFAGNSGPVRDTTNESFLNNNDPILNSNFSTDWQLQNNQNVNLKLSDVDGNGILDATDIAAFGTLTPLSSGSASIYYRHSSSNSTVSNDILRLFPEQAIVAPGSTIRFYITLGQALFPMDSISGVSFTSSYDTSLANNLNFIPLQSNLGDPGLNLIATSISNNSGIPGFIICRTDHQNSFNLGGDTIGIIELQARHPSSATYLRFDFTGVNGILSSGTLLSMITHGDSVLIDPNFNNIENPEWNSLSIFPNPASHNVNLDFKTSAQREIEVIDALGRMKTKIRSREKHVTLNIQDLVSGIYYLSIQENGSGISRRITVIH